MPSSAWSTCAVTTRLGRSPPGSAYPPPGRHRPRGPASVALADPAGPHPWPDHGRRPAARINRIHEQQDVPARPDRAGQGAGPRSPPGSNGHPAANHPTHHNRRPRTGPGPSAPSNAARHGPKPAPHQPVTAQPSSPTPSPPCGGTTLDKAHRRSADFRYTTRCAPPPCGRTRSKRKTQPAVTGGYLLCASRDCAFA